MTSQPRLDAAAREHGLPISEHIGFFQVVRGENDGPSWHRRCTAQKTAEPMENFPKS